MGEHKHQWLIIIIIVIILTAFLVHIRRIMWSVYWIEQCFMSPPAQYHRLCGSASPVLTATHHSYESLAWLSDFFPHSPRGQAPQPILTQNGSINVDSRKDVPFAVKIANFHTPLISRAPKRSKFCKFLDLQIFRLIWPLTLEVTERTPLILHRSSMKVT